MDTHRPPLPAFASPSFARAALAALAGFAALTALAVSSPARAAPNETCGDATPLLDMPARIEASTLDLDTAQPASPCALEDDYALWYRFVVPPIAVEQAMVFTVESDFDTTLALYGACDTTPIVCLDDQPHDLAPKFDQWLEPGTTMWLRVGGWGATRGDFTLRVEPLNASSRPVNDRCEDALEVTQARPAHAASWNASGEDLSSCGPEDAVDLWYRFVAPSDGHYDFAIEQNLISAHYITVFDGCADTDATAAELACGFAGTGVDLAAGQEVKLRVGTNPSAADWFNVAAYPAPPAAVPPNDSWTGAIPVGVPSSTTASTRGATRESFNWGPDCGPWPQSAIWYEFTAPTADVYVFDTSGSALEDTVIALFEPCDARGDGPPGLYACNDFDAPGEHGRLDGYMEAGQRVCIAVAGRHLSDHGDITLNVTREPPPPVNDTCDGALPIHVGEQLYGINYSSRPVDVFTQCPYGNFPLWYRFTAPADGLYKIDAKNGRDSWPDLAVLASCEPTAAMIVCSADDQPAVPVRMRRGETVYIRTSTTVWWRGVVPLRVGPVRDDDVEPGPEEVEVVEDVEPTPEPEAETRPETIEPEPEPDVADADPEPDVAEPEPDVADAEPEPDTATPDDGAEPAAESGEADAHVGGGAGCGCSGGDDPRGTVTLVGAAALWLTRRRGVRPPT